MKELILDLIDLNLTEAKYVISLLGILLILAYIVNDSVSHLGDRFI